MKSARKRQKGSEKEKRVKEIKVAGGCWGGLGHLTSVAKTIHFHPSSVAHFIQMHMWCPTEPYQGSDTLSGVRLAD